MNDFKYTGDDAVKIMSPQLAANFLLYLAVAVILGIVLSRIIEVPMLKIRDKHFPRRAAIQE